MHQSTDKINKRGLYNSQFYSCVGHSLYKDTVENEVLKKNSKSDEEY